MFDKRKSQSKDKGKDLKLKQGSEEKNLPDKVVTDRLEKLEAEMALSKKSKPDTKAQDDSFTESTADNKHFLFWSIVALTVILAKLPFSGFLFTPLNQFATMIHEMSHALMTVLTGGIVSGMTIVSDGQGHGGLTMCHGGIPFIHIQAGYLGTAITGCILIFLGQYKHLAKPTLIALSLFTILGSVVFMGAGLFAGMLIPTLMSLLWALALSGLLLVAGIKLKEKQANFALLFLAIHTAMDSLRSIGMVFTAALLPTGVFSDATNMAKLYFLPPVFWSLSWATISIVMLGLTLWFCYGRKKSIPKSRSQNLA